MTSPSPQPDHEEWALVFTTLYDDEPTQQECDPLTEDVVVRQSTACSTSHTSSLELTSRKRPANEDQNEPFYYVKNSKKRKIKKATQQPFPGQLCFDSFTGEAAQAPKRSRFPPERKAEMREVRKFGACIRCMIRKISCSRGRPCEACVDLLNAREGSRCLMWMECIQPSFVAIGMFKAQDPKFVQSKLNKLIRRYVNKEGLPFEPSSAFTVFIEFENSLRESWLKLEMQPPPRMIDFITSCAPRDIFEQTFGRDFFDHLVFFILLFNDIVQCPEYHGDPRIGVIYNHVGHTVLQTVESQLKPASLKRAKANLEYLYALILALLALAFLTVWHLKTIKRRMIEVEADIECKIAALWELVGHYTAYLARLGNLITPESEKSFLENWGQPRWSTDGQPRWEWD